MSDDPSIEFEVLPPAQAEDGTKLFMVAILAHRTDLRNGRFRVRPAEKIGPVLSPSQALAEQYAAGCALKAFRGDWEQARYLVCAIPPHLVTGAAEALGMVTPLQVEQQVKAARDEGFQRGREQGLREAKQSAKEARQAVRKGNLREYALCEEE